MARRKRQGRSPKKTESPTTRVSARKNLLHVGLPALLVAVLAALVYLVATNNSAATPDGSASAMTSSPMVRKARSLDALLSMTPEQLANVNIAEMNLLCATGLPGAETLDIDHCLTTLDEWAARVKFETQRHLYRAHDARWADHYKHSANWLRAEFLAQVLQEDLNVHYNMERLRNIDFTNSKDLFIHGMIDDTNGGTCVSMPVVYVAIGRRLGYPLKIVLSKAHVFARWDGKKHPNPAWRERFNIEATGNGGVESYPDSHYTEWPKKISEAEVKRNRYLVSLSPAEELASFLASRGHCLLDNGRARKAFDAYASAHRLASRNPAYSAWMRQAEARFRRPAYAIGPQGFREPPRRHRVLTVEEINAQNRQAMDKLMRPPASSMPGALRPYRPPARGQPKR